MSIRRNYSNTATDTTLTSTITDSSTSLTVVTASGYPSRTPFTIGIDSEIILVQETSGTTFKNLSRGYDGTVAAAHSTSTTVEHVAIADDFDWRFIDPITNDDSVLDSGDQFSDESLDASWTQVTPTGTATWTEARGKLSVMFDNQSSNDCAALVKSMASLTHPLYLVLPTRTLSWERANTMAGPVFSDGTLTSSNCVWFMPYDNADEAMKISLRSGTFDNISTTESEPSSGMWNPAPWIYWRLDWVATNTWRYWGSIDGVSWSSLGNASNITSTLTPTHFGIGVSTWGDSTAYTRIASFEGFRVYTSKPTYWQEL